MPAARPGNLEEQDLSTPTTPLRFAQLELVLQRSRAVMKHGVAFRKLSRTSSHRMLMLRNQVTSLFEHEHIKTTLPKARETARLAEKIITMGKQGDLPAYRRAGALLMKPAMLSKLFKTLAPRYAERPGGYTRIHKFGNRAGDNAPAAVLELVDNPHDLKLEMTSRAVGYEFLAKKVQGMSGPFHNKLFNDGLDKAELKAWLEQENSKPSEKKGELKPLTKWNLQKVSKYRDVAAQILDKAQDHADNLMLRSFRARGSAAESMKGAPASRVHEAARAILLKPGKAVPGMERNALRIAKGALAKPLQPSPKFAKRTKLGIESHPFQLDFNVL